MSTTTTNEVIETESVLSKCGEWKKSIDCNGKGYYYCSKLKQEEVESEIFWYEFI